MSDLETLARWMIQRGYATGHGDTVEDLLVELEWQVAEREREAVLRVCALEGITVKDIVRITQERNQ